MHDKAFSKQPLNYFCSFNQKTTQASFSASVFTNENLAPKLVYFDQTADMSHVSIATCKKNTCILFFVGHVNNVILDCPPQDMVPNKMLLCYIVQQQNQAHINRSG